MTRYANKRTRKSRLLRRAGIWTYSSVLRANVFLPPPRVLLNGPPKSGTHLLSDCVSLMPRMMFSGRHFALTDFFTEPAVRPDGRPYEPGTYPALDRRRLRGFLRKCPQGMFATAHAAYHPEFKTLIEELRLRHVVLLRDPRDLVVSQAFYIKREPLHYHNRYFAETLESDEDRIMTCIRGLAPGISSHKELFSIGELFEGFLPWLADDSTLVVRFEDLVGARGGEDDERQLDEVVRIGEFVGRPMTRRQAGWIAGKMYGKASLTFRKGQTGDWRNHFTEAHRHAFKEETGDLLVRLGYERDQNW
ncbi:MAG: sulfotransferase domain-containing protein [Actinomycetota bacterium]